MTFVTHFARGHETSEATIRTHRLPKESVAVIIGALTIHARRNDRAYARSSKICFSHTILSLINGNQDREFDRNELKIIP